MTDSNDDDTIRYDVDTLSGEQDEFSKKMVCLRRILRAQELEREDKIKIKVQALPRLEFEDFTPEQLREIAKYKAKSLPSSPAKVSQVKSPIAKSVTMSPPSSPARSQDESQSQIKSYNNARPKSKLTSSYFLCLQDALDLEKEGIGA